MPSPSPAVPGTDSLDGLTMEGLFYLAAAKGLRVTLDAYPERASVTVRPAPSKCANGYACYPAFQHDDDDPRLALRAALSAALSSSGALSPEARDLLT